jgi:DnaK suppressor protein
MLTPAQIAKLRERLLAEKKRLERAESTLSPPVKPDEGVGDRMDEAESNFEQDEARERSEHDRALLEAVDGALEKIDAGTYGVSELSGEPIDYARLESVPWARLTAAEQEDAERAQKQRAAGR